MSSQLVISAAKFDWSNHKIHIYPNVYLWSKIELEYEKCIQGPRPFESCPNILYSYWRFRSFCSFPPENCQIGTWNRQWLLLCTGFPILFLFTLPKTFGFSIGDKTNNVQISVTLKSVPVTIVAVEKFGGGGFITEHTPSGTSLNSSNNQNHRWWDLTIVT